MKHIGSHLFFLFTISINLTVFAGEDTGTAGGDEGDAIVVTATRSPEKISHTGGSISVVTAEEIKTNQWRTLDEVLASVPGIVVRRTGSPGSTTSINLRGQPAKHVVVLIDGVEANDVSSINRGPVLDHILTDDIARVEVLRGSQSTLYGSESIGGVINIITKKGDKNTASAYTEAGSYGTVKGGAEFSVGSDKIRFSGGASRAHSDGFSAAPEDNGNQEDDSYENLTLHGRLDLRPVELLRLSLIGRHIDSELDVDDWDVNNAWLNRLADDTNDIIDAKSDFLRGEVGLELWDGRWEQTFGIGYTRHERRYFNPADRGLNLRKEENDRFLGTMQKLDWQNTLRLHRTNTLVFGAETEKEIYRHEMNVTQSNFNDKDYRFEATTDGFYLQDQIDLFDCWTTTLGVRRDDHEQFGGHTTWSVATTVRIKKTGTRLKASFGTGYKAPSLFELYGRSGYDYFDGIVGNPNLKPETSKSWDLGFEQSLWGGRVAFGSTWFLINTKDMITWETDPNTWDGLYRNTTQVRSTGLESTLSFKLPKNLTLDLRHTFTEAKEVKTDRFLQYVPRHTAHATVTWRYLDNRGTLAVCATHVGNRFEDRANNENLSDYTLVDVAASYKINDYWTVTGRVENLFDRAYEDTANYSVPGIGAFIGVQASF